MKKIVVEDNQKVVPLAYIEPNQRSAMYISGVSGSGKSTYARNMIDEIRENRKYKDYKIYLITGAKEMDPAFEKLDELYVININNPQIFNLDYSVFAKCIVVFDDYEAVMEDDLKTHLLKLLKGLLELSRKKQVIILTINHMTTNFNKTRNIIFESTEFVLFPRFNLNSCLKFLKAHMDLTKNELEEIKAISQTTRAITIRKAVPRVLVSDHVIWLL